MNKTIKYSAVLLILLILTAIPLFAFESGTASWYGGKFQGRKTANGEIFDTYKFTAAHKTLPFNTIVRVTNLNNGLSVEVRINDRGPFVKGRIIDLSRAAAEKLDMTASGVAPVRIEIISLPEGFKKDGIIKSDEVHPEGHHGSYRIQIASFSSIGNAEKCLRKLHKAGMSAEIEISDTGMFRVIMPGVKEKDLGHTKSILAGIGYNSPLIRHN